MADESHKHELKRRARELGFDACGVAAAECVDPEDRLGAWLAAGYHAGMDWMARAKDIRRDPRLKLPGAQSVIVVASNYYTERPPEEEDTGKVSRYAWGRDYHNALKKPLRALARHTAALADRVECYCCIDTGPVMERAWAERAGIGWIGKNSLVLREDLGSWFFLGVILTTLRLPPDTASTERCGVCTRCIDACPTGAIVEPRVVDSNRCLSYLSIEHRGTAPEELEAKWGDCLFGCDICQEVCPWNRNPAPARNADFAPRPGTANVNLAECLEMGEEEFRARFRGTPVLRAKKEGVARNARLVLRARAKR